jgi:hypothetical protein
MCAVLRVGTSTVGVVEEGGHGSRGEVAAFGGDHLVVDLH